MQTNGHWTDFIDDWMLLTEGLPTPRQFRLWSAIAIVSAALERRVWFRTTQRMSLCNVFVLLTARAGIGKGIVQEARDLMVDCIEPGTEKAAFHVAGHSITRAALIDQLMRASSTIITQSGSETYHSLSIMMEEFGVLLPSYEQSIIADINYLWNGPADFIEERRTRRPPMMRVPRPSISILGGATPAYLGATFPEEAWTTGFARRIFLIYGGETPYFDLFSSINEPPGVREGLLKKLGVMRKIYGCAEWSDGAVEMLKAFHRSGGEPRPTHSKLEIYTQSRTNLHLPKLSVISAIARTGALLVEKRDVERGKDWLLAAESDMPSIFMEIKGKNDMAVLEELHIAAMKEYIRGKKPIAGRFLTEFVSARVPSWGVEKIIALAERGGWIDRVSGTQDLYIPRARGVGDRRME